MEIILRNDAATKRYIFDSLIKEYGDSEKIYRPFKSVLRTKFKALAKPRILSDKELETASLTAVTEIVKMLKSIDSEKILSLVSSEIKGKLRTGISNKDLELCAYFETYFKEIVKDCIKSYFSQFKRKPIIR